MANLVLTFDTESEETKWIDPKDCSTITPGEEGTPIIGPCESCLEKLLECLEEEEDE